MSGGPLQGVRVVELAGLGPGPMVGMLLADQGAEVVRIERAGDSAGRAARHDTVLRGRRRVALDLKDAQDHVVAASLIAEADVLVEGFRPGVMERLRLGPAVCLPLNPRLVYARITGWGQSGPLAQAPGHDLNYLALTGALHAFGRAGQPPTAPINLMADYAGGALYAVAGILAALLETQRSGVGQVVDVAMIDGVTSLMAKQYALLAAGARRPERGVNLLDGGAFFYDVYECADGEWLAVGCIEPQFYAALLQRLGVDAASLPAQHDVAGWPAGKAALAERFRSRPRDDWAALFADSDACVTPVLSMTEAPAHPHNRARDAFFEVDGASQPAPAPRFSRTPPTLPAAPPERLEEARDVLSDWRRPRTYPPVPEIGPS
jgi:crotonobetainyl-CoA:carnitine CoA-transferase CaiB-like acyl-CoA transferase